MKKLTLAVIGFFAGLLAAFSQPAAKDTGTYKSRKLRFEEANIVTSYYSQSGNNSAVTGGVGTEKLSDFSNSLEVKLKRYDRKDRKHNVNLELGIDHYTSASSDKIDPSTISSASSADTRFYPSLNWTMENEQKGVTVGAGLSFSSEFDYTSYGAGVHLSKKTKNRSGEFSVRLQAYMDQVSNILPVELRNTGAIINNPRYDKDGWTSRDSYSAAFSYSQIVNQHLQLSFLFDVIQQQGFLGLPFHRIYFSDNTEGVETLPESRFKLPVAVRVNYFAGDKFIIRSFYRYYSDNWGLKAHTLNIETPVKISPFFSISPFYRFYSQHGVDYFKGYKMHSPTEEFYTSNYDLSTFNSQFFGAGLRLAPPGYVFGIKHLASLELRYGHYMKNIGMQSNIISLHLGIR